MDHDFVVSLTCGSSFLHACVSLSFFVHASRMMSLLSRSLTFASANRHLRLGFCYFPQDVVIWRALVMESWLPRWMRTMSPDMQKLLRAKVYPPIFQSWDAFASLFLPVMASCCLTTPFVYGLANLQAYPYEEANATATG